MLYSPLALTVLFMSCYDSQKKTAIISLTISIFAMNSVLCEARAEAEENLKDLNIRIERGRS